MQLTEIARTTLEKRYLVKDEDGKPAEQPEDMLKRVARVIANGNEVLEKNYFAMMDNLEFLPNSPTLMNAGRDLGQLSACFVLPVEDSMEGIFDSVKHTALIHKSGGGTGFSFSRLRPTNDKVKTTQGVSSGPISFMQVFNAATETVKQGGTRRGANMGILRIDHPDIMQFIDCKLDKTALTNFNISVGLTEEFMEAVLSKQSYRLYNPRTKDIAATLDAREVFNKIVKNAWENGEPGIIFLDRLNRDNPTPHIGEIEATNPCGEQPLLPYESCNLGSINLVKFVKDGKIDYKRLKSTVHTAVNFLNGVIDVNKYPLKQIEDQTKGNRKIGLGVMGWAETLILLGIPYNSHKAIEIADEVMQFINSEGHRESERLAKVNGAYPNFIGKLPIRNATVTTIAPTGTISMIAGVASGVEPLFAICFMRRQMDIVMYETNWLFTKMAKERGFYSTELLKKITDNHGSVRGIAEVPIDIQKLFVTAHDITPDDHIQMQAAFQEHTDNAVSKTINFSSDATEKDVEDAYILAYTSGCKGVTIYRDGSRDEQVLSTGSSKIIEPTDNRRDRPQALTGLTYQMQTGCGPLYITINEDDQGVFELFTMMGKAGGCAASQSEAMGRMVSLAWRSGVEARQVMKQLKGISCHKPSGFGENRILSCADAVATAIEKHLNEHIVIKQERGACPECGGSIEHEGGCAVCRVCGYSECA